MTEKIRKRLYTDEQLARLDRNRIPHHIAIVMDGNRRWARRHKLDTARGHWEGGEALRRTLRAATELGIGVLTVFAFSTENWERSKVEVQALLSLIENYLVDERAGMVREGIKLETIGDISRFPARFVSIVEATKEATAAGSTITLVLALNYGGRDDLCRAMKTIAKEYKEGVIDTITEETIAAHLDTAPWGDPSIMIRTGGERRLSNFMLWQLSYAEIYVAEMLWPEFGADALLEALCDYQTRKQRFGR